MRKRSLKQIANPSIEDICDEFGGDVQDVVLEPSVRVEEDGLFAGLPDDWPEPSPEDRHAWSRWHMRGFQEEAL